MVRRGSHSMTKKDVSPENCRNHSRTDSPLIAGARRGKLCPRGSVRRRGSCARTGRRWDVPSRGSPSVLAPFVRLSPAWLGLFLAVFCGTPAAAAPPEGDAQFLDL